MSTAGDVVELRRPDLRRGAGGVLWSTVSVEAESAALADALSTAGCMMDADALHRAATALGGVRRITLVTHAGDLRSLSV